MMAAQAISPHEAPNIPVAVAPAIPAPLAPANSDSSSGAQHAAQAATPSDAAAMAPLFFGAGLVSRLSTFRLMQLLRSRSSQQSALRP